MRVQLFYQSMTALLATTTSLVDQTRRPEKTTTLSISTPAGENSGNDEAACSPPRHPLRISPPNQPDPWPPPSELRCHTLPPGSPPDEYTSNPTPFGAILRGDRPVRTVAVSEQILAFVDQTPRAPLHVLVIPKRRINSVRAGNFSNEVAESLHGAAMKVLQKHCPTSAETGDYILCYHVPPFNSVDHLHLHVLAPASQMAPLYRYGKYATETLWCVSDRHVRHRLHKGLPPVPSFFLGCYLF